MPSSVSIAKSGWNLENTELMEGGQLLTMGMRGLSQLHHHMRARSMALHLCMRKA